MELPEVTTFKGIIFDLDGTLYRMERFFQPLMFFSLFPRPFRLLRFLAERSKLAGTDFGSHEQLLEKLCVNLAEKEHDQPDRIREWISTRFYPAFISAMRFQRHGRPGLVQTLRQLHTSGIRLAVLSDYHAVEERLRMLRIPLECFDPISSCESAGALKPASRPFLDIARSWELPAGEVLVVGDRDDTDGKAARGAGMEFVQIIDGQRGKQQKDRVYSWEAVRERLLRH